MNVSPVLQVARRRVAEVAAYASRRAADSLADVPSATLPEQASWIRRFGALLVDWFASMFVVILFTGTDDYFSPGGNPSLLTLAVFVLESTVFTTLVGGSFGKLVCGLRVVRTNGAPGVDPIRAFGRAILVALVIPPLVYRPDGRGLHDMATGTATVALSRR